MGTIKTVKPENREVFTSLFDERSAVDALPRYYALSHPAQRVVLLGSFMEGHKPTGLVVRAYTGADLFRPLIIPFARQERIFTELIAAALEGVPQGLLYIPLEQRGWLEERFELFDEQVYELLRMSPQDYHRVINVLVQSRLVPDGGPRFEVVSGNDVVAAIAVNWIGQKFAEVYLDITPPALERGLAQSLFSAMAGQLFHEGKGMLLRLPFGHTALRSEALRFGFQSTEHRLLVAGIQNIEEGTGD